MAAKKNDPVVVLITEPMPTIKRRILRMIVMLILAICTMTLCVGIFVHIPTTVMRPAAVFLAASVLYLLFR